MKPIGLNLPEVSSYSGALTIELDPRDGIGPPPPPLGRDAAAELAGCIAADLGRILSHITAVGLVVPGALYDQTELLRPGFPLLDALADLYQGALDNASFTPHLLALGTDHGHFPVPAINPRRQPNSGPLLVVPFTFVGRHRDILTLSSTLENVLLQNGAASDATVNAVQRLFGLQPVNLSYASIGDLCALLQVQLENAGFADLWRLLVHALFRRPGAERVRLPAGNVLLVEGNTAFTAFYTFDDWAQFGPGRAVAGADLGDAYAAWLRGYRQYTMALEAHGLEVRRLLAETGLEQEEVAAALAVGKAMRALAGEFLVETVRRRANAVERQLLITHQFHPEEGTVAYTVLARDETGRESSLEHYYPLRPEGVNVLIEELQRRTAAGVERRVLQPGGLVYTATGRHLESAIVAAV